MDGQPERSPQAEYNYQIYAKVAGDLPSTLFGEVLGSLFIWWLVGIWRLGALIAFGIYAVVVALDVIQTAFLWLSGVALLVTGRKEEGAGWLWVGTAVRTAQAAVGLGLALFLYRTLLG